MQSVKPRITVKWAISALATFLGIVGGIIAILQFSGITRIQDLFSIGTRTSTALHATPTPSSGVLQSTPYVYQTSFPGPTCGATGGRWRLVSASATCVGLGVQLTVSNANQLGYVEFRGNGQLPSKYSISVTLAGLSDGVCAGILTNGSDIDGGEFTFAICGDGRWFIDEIGSDNQPVLLAHGNTVIKSTYAMTAVSEQADESLQINGTPLAQLTNVVSPTTDFVSLFVDPVPTGASAAILSNFAFAELT